MRQVKAGSPDLLKMSGNLKFCEVSVHYQPSCMLCKDFQRRGIPPHFYTYVCSNATVDQCDVLFGKVTSLVMCTFVVHNLSSFCDHMKNIVETIG